MDLNALQQQHVDLHAHATQFRQAVSDDRTPRRMGLIRWQFARLLMTHLAMEDRLFYPHMRRQPNRQLRDAASRLEHEMAPIAERFSDFMARWTDGRIEGEWRDFCYESRQMLDMIVERMRKEERLLMPLLAEAGLIHSPTLPA